MPRHLHQHSYASVSARMNCFHMCTNIHMFVHFNTFEPFSPFVPFDSCSKTASRACATNGETNDAMNDEVNMWLVHSSFTSPFASPRARLCKCGSRYVNTGDNMVFIVFFCYLLSALRIAFLPTTLASLSPGVIMLNCTTTPRDSATDIEKKSRKGAPEREQPNRSVLKRKLVKPSNNFREIWKTNRTHYGIFWKKIDQT